MTSILYIISTPDLVYLDNSTEKHQISWIIVDFSINNGSYLITLNDTLFGNQSGNWLSGDKITLNVSGFEVGKYIFEIQVVDGLGNKLVDEINVIVYSYKQNSNNKWLWFLFIPIISGSGIK